MERIVTPPPRKAHGAVVGIFYLHSGVSFFRWRWKPVDSRRSNKKHKLILSKTKRCLDVEYKSDLINYLSLTT